MVTINYVKDDWVKEKSGSRLMQIDEYQIVETVIYANGNSAPMMKRAYNGKVWCTWVNENKAVVTQPFSESDLEPAVPQSAYY
jgi:predicted secreted acid phosphatase